MRINHPHRADKSVSLSDHSLQEARFRRVIVQSSANFSHDIIDVCLGINKQIRTPKFGNNVFPRNQLLAPPHQENQQLHRLLFQLDTPPQPAKLIASKVEFNFANGGFHKSAEAWQKPLSSKIQ